MNKTIAKGINAVYLPVSNPYKSSRWYVNHLGLKMLRPVNEESTQAQLGFDCGQTIFLIQTKHKQNANYIEVGGSVQCPITIEVDNFDQVYKALKSEGVEMDQVEDNGECGKNINVYDPDGNMIDIWSGWASVNLPHEQNSDVSLV